MQVATDQQFLQVNSLKQSKTGLFQFCGPSYTQWSVDLCVDQAINLFPEPNENGTGKNIRGMWGSPGIAQVSNLGGGPIRGMYAGENRLFVVSGASLFEIFEGGTATNLGNISSDGNPVFMSANGSGSQLVIASGHVGTSTTTHDLAISGTNSFVVSSADLSFTSLSVGEQLVITSGLGFLPGTYTIVSVDGFGNATLNASAGATSSSGGTATYDVGAGGYLYCDSGAGPVAQRFSVPYTDLVISGSSSDVVSSASQPFAALTDDGYTLVITGGTGFTPGTYTILSVDSDGNATLNASAGTEGSTGGIGTEYLGYVPAVQVVYLDTFFIVQAAYNSRLFYISASDDGTNWDATQVASKESYPDNITAILADHQELWLFGSEQSTEGWHNAGAAPFPLVRDDNAEMHFGCAAPWTPARFLQGFCWLGFDQMRGGPVCFYAQGFQPVRISNFAVEQIWSQYTGIDQTIAYTYIENGHHFYVLNFKAANATWVYDGSTQMWHQRAWWNGTFTTSTGANGSPLETPVLGRQRQSFHQYVNLGDGLKHYVGDYATGQVYVMSSQTYSDNGATIYRIRTAPHISAEQVLNFYHRFYLDLETGNAAMYNIALDWSDDGGHTFGNYVQGPSLGNPGIGQYGFRVIWTPLGSSFDRVFQVTISDQTKIAIVNAYLDCTAGYK
jgi:hypothetical protein